MNLGFGFGFILVFPALQTLVTPREVGPNSGFQPVNPLQGNSFEPLPQSMQVSTSCSFVLVQAMVFVPCPRNFWWGR